jgi:Xaa-Pro dipeptidase
MQLTSKLKEIQETLVQQQIGGWLLYDFHGSNPFAYQILDIPSENMLTRRFFYWIPH